MAGCTCNSDTYTISCSTNVDGTNATIAAGELIRDTEVEELRTAINQIATDLENNNTCSCEGNCACNCDGECNCNNYCGCDIQCSCYSYSDMRLKWNIIYL